MFYTDWLYWTFVAVCCLLYHMVPRGLRPWILAAAGISFYCALAGAYAFVLLAEAGAACFLAALLRRNRSIWLAAGAIVGVVAVLGYFKYSGMLIRTWTDLTNAHVSALPRAEQMIIPLGISYFTFELIHYLIESRRGGLPPHGPPQFFAFVFFFPTMAAGPIKSFPQFVPQLCASFQPMNVVTGIARIIVGLFKKLVLAGTLDLLTRSLYAPHAEHVDASQLWLSLVAYTFVIYFDFSGYSDMAIGTARLFGITLPENFRNPYFSRNIAEFWNRWHISLGSWLTKYVYYPLGGSRKSKARTYVNLMAVMAVSGIWHGAAWHFVLWGLMHGAMLCIHRFYVKEIRPLLFRAGEPVGCSPIRTAGAVAFTFCCVTMTRVFFVLPATEGWNVWLRMFSL
ncbi:MAG: MBOAT family protein [Thermobacillus sp.]|uniref:MBOAT family O-acyltransferase n=1 Tax=Thermobacillus sp. TaxID=2108467 RepID=UPI000E369188|nr:MBOAT family O-acyltransferase [Thermobacillus sp.]REK55299.1 MAG: MBOAT family protein [Thermobacillus sp.]